MGTNNTKEAPAPTYNVMTEGDLIIPRKKPKLDCDGVDMEYVSAPEYFFLDKYEGNYSYQILTFGTLISMMNESINEVQSVIRLPVKTVRALLHHFEWDQQVLLERYYEQEDMTELFKSIIGIVPEPKVLLQEDSPEEEECEICYADNSTDSMYSLSCGHKFCVQCWIEILTTKIVKEGMSDKITCPAHNCAVLIEDDTVMKLVEDQTVIYKYNQNLAKGFVESNRLVRWCLSPGCVRAIAVEQILESKPVQCECGFSFCFNCSVPWHGPLTCSLAKKWAEKCALDSENSKWISLNTKPCPKCGTPIEKNGGCNHISCQNLNCMHHFCWVCMGPWFQHDQMQAYICKAPAQKQSASLHGSLDHYLFYLHRYLNHRSSLKFEKQLYKTMKSIMAELERKQEMTYSEAVFLLESVDILCSCRNTLMNTYAFAFYLDQNIQSEIFHENLKDLTMATESLSEYIEHNITKTHPEDMKKKDKGSYCERRRQALLEHAYEGYEKNWWKYNVNY